MSMIVHPKWNCTLTILGLLRRYAVVELLLDIDGTSTTFYFPLSLTRNECFYLC